MLSMEESGLTVISGNQSSGSTLMSTRWGDVEKVGGAVLAPKIVPFRPSQRLKAGEKKINRYLIAPQRGATPMTAKVMYLWTIRKL